MEPRPLLELLQMGLVQPGFPLVESQIGENRCFGGSLFYSYENKRTPSAPNSGRRFDTLTGLYSRWHSEALSGTFSRTGPLVQSTERIRFRALKKRFGLKVRMDHRKIYRRSVVAISSMSSKARFSPAIAQINA